MTLTDFLLARIEDDEAYAVTHRELLPEEDEGFYHRLLADSGTKRSQVGSLDWIANGYYPSTPLAKSMLALLALPYADHPDYREEWRP
jgi:hypothetical protein